MVMQPIEFACPGLGSLHVMGKQLNHGYDFVVRSNTENASFDYLLFMDSRGISSEFNHSLADKLITSIAQSGKTYLLVCRPLELTIWATLIGFLALNRLEPAKIVTNMGFVDFTPKKESILQDSVQQVDSIVGLGVAKTRFVEEYFSISHEVMPLYAMTYSSAYRESIESIAARHSLVIVNTPITSPSIAIVRKRPAAFFSAQVESNEFNHSIAGAQVIDLPKFDETMTYDAVHFTRRGNKIIFDTIKDTL
jgi:hypothetical protein